jgi:hypothetical protein
MNLDKVTITGADDSVRPQDLLPLSREFPFVEWGILFSGSRQGGPRYPSETWIAELWKASTEGLALSAHLCGKWVRDLVLEANPSWWTKYDRLPEAFQRVQLNFHGQYHKAAGGFVGALRERDIHDFIFQHDGVNDRLLSTFTNTPDLHVFPLFDRSGGAGALPDAWPRPIWTYQGYAGGLGPDNLEGEIGRIGGAAGESRIWIDMETRVRSEDDTMFDLPKVRRCLEIAAPFVSAKRWVRHSPKA